MLLLVVLSTIIVTPVQGGGGAEEQKDDGLTYVDERVTYREAVKSCERKGLVRFSFSTELRERFRYYNCT